MFCTELNPTILKIFHDDDVTRCDRLTNGLQELLELLFATKNEWKIYILYFYNSTKCLSFIKQLNE